MIFIARKEPLRTRTAHRTPTITETKVTSTYASGEQWLQSKQTSTCLPEFSCKFLTVLIKSDENFRLLNVLQGSWSRTCLPENANVAFVSIVRCDVRCAVRVLAFSIR
ncbi:hypothetical protein T01_683 [Trichinella spiralis]|uniref:Uncharacterized protein n=1 Tax=Trichinella spiralis TaxID=6334 RepID=A0A0V1BDB1_TRISP|nr:hypothetical protein T01_683 [Trichinella spiralis]